MQQRPVHTLALVLAAVLLISACSAATGSALSARSSAAIAGTAPAAGAPIRIGAVFPVSSNASPLADEEALGVAIAAQLVNADGGVHGRPIDLDLRDLAAATDAPGVVAGLRAIGDRIVIGAYFSELSIAAARAASDAGLVYWEAGAVADRLTGEGLPLVFRVGANGALLGSNSARFAAAQLAPRLGRTARSLRIAIVAADDDYARSVADAAQAVARAYGEAVTRTDYRLAAPDWPAVITSVRAAAPDVLILAAHIPDGEAFRRAMLAAHLRVGALIGSTMAQCMTDFGADLGTAAIGVFASDRPTGGFDPAALTPATRALYDRFATAWRQRTGDAEPDEEGLSGFSAAWALFHDVLPAAGGDLTPASVVLAARSVNLPVGSLPNGAGLRFATSGPQIGQNLSAAAVIWQWQAIRRSVVVWPATFSTGAIRLVPLPS